MPISGNDLAGLYDGDVLSMSGEKIGRVAQIYLDDQTGEPTFVTANTGLFGTSQSFVPLRGARTEDGNIVVTFDKITVKDAPRIDDDGSLSPAEEDRLYAYYGMSQGDVDAGDYAVAGQTPEAGESSAVTAESAPPPGVGAVPPADPDAPADPGPGRLRKWVPTEPAPAPRPGADPPSAH